MFNFENLNVYKEALNFIDLIYLLTDKFPKQEIYCLISQVRRAAISIALNIAEGTSRTKKDFRHFLDLAKGSCYECVAILTISKKRGYINEKQYIEAYMFCEKLSKMISALKKSLL